MYLIKKLKKHLPYITLLTIICWATFAVGLTGDFVSDDMPGIVRNPNLLQNFTGMNLIYAASLKLFGPNPTPLHAFSLLLHNINAILVFFFVLRLFKNRKTAYIASLLFCLHPVVTEPVYWISGGHYLFNTTIILVSTLFYLHFRKTHKTRHLIFSVLTFAVGLFLLRGAWLLVLPFVITLTELFFVKTRKKLKERLFPFFHFGTAALFTAIYFINRILSRLEFMKGGGTKETAAAPSYFLRASYTLAKTLELLVFPKDLSLYHEGQVVPPWFLLLGQLVFLTSIGLAVYLISEKKLKTAGLIFGIYISILPALSPIQVSWFIADR